MSLTVIEPWAVRRENLAVSARDPVLFSVHRHEQPFDTAYDMHYALELGIVLSGKMRRLYRNWETTVGPSEAWLCGMWEPHGYQVVSKPCEVIVCVIWPPFLAELRFPEAPGFNWLAPFAAPPELRPRVSHRRRGAFRSLADRFKAVLKESAPRRRLWLRLLFQEALLDLTREWAPPLERGGSTPHAFAHVNRAIEIVFANRRLVPVQEVARECAMSRNRFSRLFRDVMGLGFPQFALRYRLSGAAGQLATGEEPIKAIALGWGFTDDSHLHRLFHKHYGMSPLQYRRHWRNSAAGKNSLVQEDGYL